MGIQTIAIVGALLLCSSAAVAATNTPKCQAAIDTANKAIKLDAQLEDQLKEVETRLDSEKAALSEIGHIMQDHTYALSASDAAAEERVMVIITVVLGELQKTSTAAHDLRLAREASKKPIADLRAEVDKACAVQPVAAPATTQPVAPTQTVAANQPAKNYGPAYLKLVNTTDDTEQLQKGDPDWAKHYVGFGKDADSIDYHQDPNHMTECGAMHLSWDKPDDIMRDGNDYTITLTGKITTPPTNACATNLELALAPIFAGTTTDLTDEKNPKVTKLETVNSRAGILVGRTTVGLTPTTVKRSFTIHPTEINAKGLSNDDHSMTIIIGSATITYHYKIEK